MDKIWYIEINSLAEGPYSIEELESDRRINPDTRIWKEGFSKWKMIRDVPELKNLFSENKNKQRKKKNNIPEEIPSSLQVGDQLVLDMRMQPPYFWILVALITLFYIFFHLYRQ